MPEPQVQRQGIDQRQVFHNGYQQLTEELPDILCSGCRNRRVVRGRVRGNQTVIRPVVELAAAIVGTHREPQITGGQRNDLALQGGFQVLLGHGVEIVVFARGVLPASRTQRLITERIPCIANAIAGGSGVVGGAVQNGRDGGLAGVVLLGVGEFLATERGVHVPAHVQAWNAALQSAQGLVDVVLESLDAIDAHAQQLGEREWLCQCIRLPQYRRPGGEDGLQGRVALHERVVEREQEVFSRPGRAARSLVPRFGLHEAELTVGRYVVGDVVGTASEQVVFRERYLQRKVLTESDLNLGALAADVDALWSQAAIVLHAVGRGQIREDAAVRIDSECAVIGATACDRCRARISSQDTIDCCDGRRRPKESCRNDALGRTGELPDVGEERPIRSVYYTPLRVFEVENAAALAVGEFPAKQDTGVVSRTVTMSGPAPGVAQLNPVEVIAHLEVHDAGDGIGTVRRRGTARNDFHVVDD